MNRNFRHSSNAAPDAPWSSKNIDAIDDFDASSIHHTKRYRNLHNNAARKKIEAKKRRDLFDDEYDVYN